MLLVRAPTHLTVRFVSAAPSVTTGIEHAIKFKEIGKRYQQDFKDYKCSDYLHYNRLSFYDFEVCFLYKQCIFI